MEILMEGRIYMLYLIILLWWWVEIDRFILGRILSFLKQSQEQKLTL